MSQFTYAQHQERIELDGVGATVTVEDLGDGLTDPSTYLGTGISDLRAAKRYLRRKWNAGKPDPVVTRPGAFFYVTARKGRQTAFLLGPYVSHMTALSAVPRARQLINHPFLELGTASTPSVLTTVYGR